MICTCISDARDEAYIAIPRAQHEALMEKAKAWYLVNVLRKSEGHAVTLMCDNPDFNGQPNCAIEVYGEHTDWQAKRFTGDTVIEALEKAVAAAALTPAPPSEDK